MPEPSSGGYRFDRFTLDLQDRRLTCDGAPVDISYRYLDALVLLVTEAGRLVSKDRFMAEVWKGVPVTDEALTQCIRSLRKALGDDAARPRFIETAPKHGYRFIAPVTRVDAVTYAAPAVSEPMWRRFWLRGAAGMIGGGAAGALGGVIYGAIAASTPAQGDIGGASLVLALTGLCLWVGLVGGAGVGFGVAGSNLRSAGLGPWSILGGALGGLILGGVVKLVGTDALTLLFGQSPGRITGAGEGLLLGAAIGLGAWMGSGDGRLRWGMIAGGLAAGVAGLIITLLGGTLMAGSLDQVASRFSDSRLSLSALSALVGEPAFGPVTAGVTAALEGLLFGSFVVGALVLARRSLSAR